jgi:hypothetical protein
MAKVYRVGSSTPDGVISYQPQATAIVFPFKRQDIRKLSASKDVDAIMETSNPLVIQNDIMSLSISKQKSAPSAMFNMVLASGRVNYEEAIYPGDWIMLYINRFNKEIDLSNIDISQGSGFKLFGVVTEVFREQQTSASGATMVSYRITGSDWGFIFNSQIYFNPATLDNVEQKQELDAVFFTLQGVQGDLNSLIKPEQQIQLIFKNIIGQNPREAFVAGSLKAPHRIFLVPAAILKLFKDKSFPFDNEKHAKSISNIIERRLGVERYASTLVPQKTNQLLGRKIFRVEYTASPTLWSLLQNHSNSLLNEIYTELLPSTETGDLKPTFVARQMPYNTKTKIAGATTTSFFELPIVSIPENFIISKRLGRSLNTLINFIQLWSNTLGEVNAPSLAEQSSRGNYDANYSSIVRYGLRTMATTADFDSLIDFDPSQRYTVAASQTPTWVRILSDWYMDMYLLRSGDVTVNGIEEHLPVGYNIALEDTLYHLEGYSHSYNVTSSGHTFRTTLNLSMGRRLDKYQQTILKNQATTQIDLTAASQLGRDQRGYTSESEDE